MSVIPLSLWFPLSVAACVLLVLAAVVWLWRRAQRIAAQSSDGRPVRNVAVMACVGLLLWLAYGLLQGYGLLWGADALIVLAYAPRLLQMPLIVGGLAWIVALLVGRIIALQPRGD